MKTHVNLTRGKAEKTYSYVLLNDNAYYLKL